MVLDNMPFRAYPYFDHTTLPGSIRFAVDR